jgi:thiol-disulfide isomerase/thioredoxin
MMNGPHFLKALLFLVAVLMGLSIQMASSSGQRTGDNPPLLQATTLLQAPPGATMDALSLHGKVVVLEFWATWCGPCVAAIPHLNELADKFKDQPVQFIAVTAENEATIKSFLTKRPIHAWVVLDTDRAMNTACNIPTP